MRKLILLVAAALILVILPYSAMALPDSWSDSTLPGMPAKVSETESALSFNLDHLVDFGMMIELIKTSYYKDVDTEQCIANIYASGLGGCLDPNSRYMTPEDREESRAEINDQGFGGIGVELTLDGEKIKISSVLEGQPAERAGLKDGDIITDVEVNGKPEQILVKTHLALLRATRTIRGPVGTKVRLGILRDGKRTEFLVERAVIKTKHVSYRLLGGNVGYVKVKDFDGFEVYNQFNEAIGDLAKRGAVSFVLDFRNNAGGLLMPTLSMLLLFEQDWKSTLLIQQVRDRKGKTTDEIYTASRSFSFATLNEWSFPSGNFDPKKTVILINRNSASASEIFAAYMKHKGAQICCETSYKKGTVQTTFSLITGAGLHLTTAEYFVSGERIKVDGVGVEPDYKVDNPKDWSPRDTVNDLQLKKAIELLSK